MAKDRAKTQEQKLLEMLEESGERGVTPMDALRIAHSFRLAARIYDLKAKGHDIETTTYVTEDGAHVARYILHPPVITPVQMGLF